MPIYLCQPGAGSEEPWRHGVQVYERPFPLNDSPKAGPAPRTDIEDGPEQIVVAGGRGELGLEPLARGGDDDERGRPMNAVPLREDSHSPVPHYQEGGTDAPARRGGDGRSDNEGGDANVDNHELENEEGDGAGEGGEGRARQRQFLENRNARLTSSHSSDDDDDSRHEGGNAAPVDAAERPRPAFRRSLSTSAQTAAQEAREELARERTALLARERLERSRPNPVRRVRHAEVVLADQCLVAYGRTWLRLRWPGEHGGFGGFIALSRVEKGSDFKKAALQDGGYVRMLSGRGDDRPLSGMKTAEEELSGEDVVLCQEVGASSPPPPPDTATAASGAAHTLLLCEETGVHYPTSAAMKLLMSYDDGLSGKCTEEGGRGMEDILKTTGENGEPVFCRICREGLHDVNYDLEATPPPAEGGGEGAAAEDGGEGADAPRQDAPRQDAVPPLPFDVRRSLAGLPPVVARHPTAENPLLAPCDCTGTMAFVHYLCVEQWRCRSRHPGAREGLSCETCGAGYALPPPPSRPAGRDAQGMGGAGGPGGVVMAEDDWLDAMPPHVLAALRRPHPAWQLGAAVVRRRWLRPVVPVLVSPLVALYCRARRTLKKRGVSRRRWACSLCRRRARWKCVRCLRSYYCSRQCQNVSWHIVHKHVCYKPVRFWWSVVVYTAGVFMAVPGLVENFPVYDAMVTLLPLNFIALGIVFGGIASALKRSSGVDVRGRVLEIIVVLQTLLLTGVTSGLVRGYFGEPERCWGAFHSAAPAAIMSSTFAVDTTLDTMGTKEGETGVLGEAFETGGNGVQAPTLTGPFPHPLLNAALVDVPLGQIRLWYLKWDFILSKLGPLSMKFLCTPPDVFRELDGSIVDKADVAMDTINYSVLGCSPPTRTINPKFYLEPSGGGRCSSDMSLVLAVWFAALGVLLLGNAWRHLRGARRNGGGGGGGDRRDRGRRRVHHDHQD